MKKYMLLLASIISGVTVIYANPVDLQTAQKAASNFYSHQFAPGSMQITLVYTEISAQGSPVYYVFNINTNEGFVVVSAEDATDPILGYSNEGGYVVPKDGNNNIGYWMQSRKEQILAIRANKLNASSTIKNEWTECINNSFPTNNTHRVSTFVGPLLTTTWDQEPYYNDMCPGGSLTGCVATTMAQIMKYWQYPPHGIGSSCYDDATPKYLENYGTLCAYYDTSNYNWSAMPNNVTSANSEVAELMYDCGVSVDMNYSPTASGAEVTVVDNPAACAQLSFVNYFGYSKYISEEQRTSYTTANWLTLIETDLNAGRPVEYAGTDVTYGGHTWVCDGFNIADNYLHMNWGWSGTDDGYYNVDTLNPNIYLFSTHEEVLTQIQPPPASISFVGNPLSGCSGMKVQYEDQSITPKLYPVTAWSWSFPGGTPATSTAQNPLVTYNTIGGYNVTEVVTTAKGKDTLLKSNYVYAWTPSTAPYSQNFEGVFPPTHWSENNPNSYFNTWQQADVGGYGKSSHSMYYDNCDATTSNIGNRQQMYTASFNLSSIPNPEIYFDVAYAPYNATYSDTLAVYYSTNCGDTWTQFYIKGGTSLCTTGGKTIQSGANTVGGCFSPLSTNWRTDTVHLSILSGESSVMFSFEDRCGKGSDLYIDNINIAEIPEAIFNLSEYNSLFIYPNPSDGNINIKFDAQTGNTYDLSIYNILGQEVTHNAFRSISGQFEYPVNLSSFGKGIYTVVLKSNSQQTIKKVAVF